MSKGMLLSFLRHNLLHVTRCAHLPETIEIPFWDIRARLLTPTNIPKLHSDAKICRLKKKNKV